MKHSNRQDEDRLLTPAETAARLRVCSGTLYSLRKKGVLNPVRIGDKILRYRQSDVDACLAGTKKNE